MKPDGAILSVKHSESYYGTNIWRVFFKLKLNGKVIERDSIVVGLPSCSGEDMEWMAANAVARSYGGRKIKIISAQFVATGIAAGHYHDLIAAQFKHAECGEGAEQP